MNPTISDLITRYGPAVLLDALREQLDAEAADARHLGQREEACTLEAIASSLRVASMWYAKLEGQVCS